MADNIKNMIIGLFILAAGAIVVFILLFLNPPVGDEDQIIHVRFSDIDKINIGTRVTFAGKPVGEVIGIKQIEKSREGPSDQLGHLYVYELTLAVDSRLRVFDTDEVALRTSGLLGERSVAIIPLAPKPGHEPKLLEKNQVIYASESGSIEDTMKELKQVSDLVEITLENLNGILQQVRKEDIVKRLGDTAQNLSDITAALNQPDELAAIIHNLQEFSGELAKRLPASWDVIDASLANTRDWTLETKTIFNKMSKGEGSAGKILINDDLYLRLTALLNKGEVIMDDINHYGLLYNLDKGWQRTRARRANLLQKLCTPQEFRNYFNDEIDQISTSLSRVNMVLTKTECMCPCLYDDCEFSKVFADLLRRVEVMQESLQMYNQQLADCDVKKTELQR